MPTVNNWEDWEDMEDKSQDDIIREKINHKSKKHDLEEWHKLEKTLEKESKDKHVKNKHREAHKNNHNDS